MSPASKYRIGLRYGVITGLIYIILLFVRYKYFASNPVSFFWIALAGYTIIFLMYLFTGMARKKELGGYGEIKEIFQSIFIVILITELVYVIFNFVYLKWLDPGFWENFKAGSRALYIRNGLPDEDIKERMRGIQSLEDNVKPSGLIKGFGAAVIMDSIIGFIFAVILRKKKPVPKTAQEEPKL
jgi:heme/copper-type cytochrome/quinol oxidase subunit 4